MNSERPMGDQPLQPAEDLIANVAQYDFVSAVRAITAQDPSKSLPGTAIRHRDESLRLSQRITTGFSGTTLDDLKTAKGKYRLFVNFFGLLGTNGPLPSHYSEYADKRARHDRDPTFYEFIDLFNHRMLSYFYRAIAEFDPAINLDRPDSNNFDQFIGAIGGYGFSESRGRDRIPDYAKYDHAFWFSCKAKSPDGVCTLIRSYFGFHASVDEFVGAWLKLPTESQSQLSATSGNLVLGTSSYIGRRVWSSKHKFRINLGPLDWNDYASFKPGESRLSEFHDLIRNYVGDEWDWELALTLGDNEVRPMRLDRGTRLGFDSWLIGSGSKVMNEKSRTINLETIRSYLH